jgi:hypothetical protein
LANVAGHAASDLSLKKIENNSFYGSLSLTEHDQADKSSGSAQLPALYQILEQAQKEIDNPTLQFPLIFSFIWDGIEFECSINKPRHGQSRLSLKARLGYLPFSAENPDGRRHMIAILEQSKLRDHDQITKDAQGLISFSSLTDIDEPTDLHDIIKALTIILFSIETTFSRLHGCFSPIS